MSHKLEKPVLSGQRIKTRKRDEKEKFDIFGFRDQLLQGLLDAGTDLEALSKFLDGAGSKLDYRRYGETLFDILIAGGIIGTSGVTPGDGGKLAPACVFAVENSMEALRAQEQVFFKLTRRYKYLEKMFDEEMRKVYTYMKQFSKEERVKLARMTALWLCNGALSPSVLSVIAVVKEDNRQKSANEKIVQKGLKKLPNSGQSNRKCNPYVIPAMSFAYIQQAKEHLVKDNLALDFILEVFVTWKQEKGISNVVSGLKKAGLETKMMEFFPLNKRTHEHFINAFKERELGELIKLQEAQASQEVKKDMQKYVSDALADNKVAKEIINEVKEYSQKNNLVEHEVVTILWTTLMSAIEWNKKEELVAEQALKHLKNYTSLLGAFCQNPKSELTLMLRIQDFCYDNMNFMKVFQKIVLLLYKTDVLSEDVIMRWYKDSHSSKGKSVFLEQMKKFIEWLQNAEEESESGEEEN